MLRAIEDLDRMKLSATDGEIGRVEDVYFDDQDWTLRYLVVDTGGWLSGRQVLIAPLSIVELHWDDRQIEVALTREQVRNSPSIDAHAPVSRQYESELYDYYGYPYYWAGPFLWGSVALPRGYANAEGIEAEHEVQRRRDCDPRLRSVNEVGGYQIGARDGMVGHVEDFLFDNETWALRYLVVDTRNWLPGHHVLVSVEWIEEVDWHQSTAYTSLTRDAIRASPKYHRDMVLMPEDEARIYMHYGRSLGRNWARGSQ